MQSSKRNRSWVVEVVMSSYVTDGISSPEESCPGLHMCTAGLEDTSVRTLQGHFL